MNTRIYNQDGAAAILMLIGTAILGLLIALTLHKTALSSLQAGVMEYNTAKSFYAAESCIAETVLQLKADETYTSPYSEQAPLLVGDAPCYVTQTTNPADPTIGTVTAYGAVGSNLRTIVVGYDQAGTNPKKTHNEIMLIHDRSGSMQNDGYEPGAGGYYWDDDAHAYLFDPTLGGMQPIRNAQNAAINFALQLDDQFDTLGMISYSQHASIDAPLTTNYNGVITHILNIDTDGYTNIAHGILRATESYVQKQAPDTARYAILLTDGHANRPLPSHHAYDDPDLPVWVTHDPNTGDPLPEDVWPTQLALYYSQLARDADITIFTISLGDDTNTQLMQAIAQTTGGAYYHAPNSSDLDQIYTHIKQEIEDRSIQLSAWEEL